MLFVPLYRKKIHHPKSSNVVMLIKPKAEGAIIVEQHKTQQFKKEEGVYAKKALHAITCSSNFTGNPRKKRSQSQQSRSKTVAPE